MPEFTSYTAGTPCWVDVTSPDLDRSIAFYGGLFGWEAERDPNPESGGYTMFTKNGKNVAGGSPPQGEPTGSHWTTYLASDDADATARRVTGAGGTVLLEPFDVFDAGRMAIAQDPAGAVFGVWQAKEHIGAQLANEPGSLSWNENQTTDPDTAGAFYRDVFGYDVEPMQIGEGRPPYYLLKLEGRGVAGMMEIRPDMEGVPPNWSTTFAVADADAATAQAEELGGTVLVPPFDIPGVGRYAVLRDPVGAVFGVMAG